MKIQKFLAMMLVAFIGVFSSCQYDDEELWDSVNDLAGRVSALEALTKQMNSDISAMQSVIAAWEKNVSITNVETLTDGYILHFSNDTKAVIKNGKDGADGEDGKDGKDGKDGVNALVIDVAQENGVYYWTITVGGETTWLLDDAGNKLPVSGKDGSDGEDGKDGVDGEDGKDGEDGTNGADGEDGKDGADGKDGKNGITPILKIDADGYWMVSYDSGTTYSYVLNADGKKVNAVGPKGDKGETGDTGAMGPSGSTGSSGDSMFSSVVDNGNGTVTITLTNNRGSFTFNKVPTIIIKDKDGNVIPVNDIPLHPTNALVLSYEFPDEWENASVEIVKTDSIEATLNDVNKTFTITQNSDDCNGKLVALFYSKHQTITSVLTFKTTVAANNLDDVESIFDDYTSNKYKITATLDAELTGTNNVIELPSIQNRHHVRTLVLTDIAQGASLKIDGSGTGTDGFYGTIIIEIPENEPALNLTADVPYGTVYVKRGNVSELYSTSGEYTTIISEGATVEKLVVKKGHVLIEDGSIVESVTRDNSNTEAITYVFYEGTVPTDKDTEKIKHRPADLYYLLKAAKNGGNVTLTRNVTLDEPVTISADVTLDLGFNVLNASKTGFIVSKGTFNINNGILYANKAGSDAISIQGETGANIQVNVESNAALQAGDCCIVVPGSNLSNNVTITTAGYLVSTGEYNTIQFNGNAKGVTLNVTGGEITSIKADAAGIYFPCDGKLSISGGIIAGSTAVYIKSGDLEITDGTLIGRGEKKAYQYYGNGCHTTGDALVIDNCAYPEELGNLSVSGGTFISENANAVGSYCGNDVTEIKTGFISGGTFSDASAFNYLANTASIKMGANTELSAPITIAADKTVTLDLNGKTISQEKAQTAAYSMITNMGTLTIKDSAANGKITYKDITEYKADVNYVSNTITNNGTLTLESGTIENTSSDNVMDYGFPHAIDVYQGSTTNIKGGTVKSENYDCIRMFCNSTTLATTVNISGGNIYNRVSFQNPGSNTAGYGRLNISGGTLTTTFNVNANVRLLNFSTDASNMKATISGGIFDKGVKTQDIAGAGVKLTDWLTVSNVTINEVQ